MEKRPFNIHPSLRFMAVLATAMITPAASSIALAEGQPVGRGPVKIFLMAGQSNMEGHAKLSTIDFLGEDSDPARAALLKKFKPDGKKLVTREDVWVMSNGSFFDRPQPGLGSRKDAAVPSSDIGPEYGFGYFMAEALQEQVLLIKVAEGGTTLHQNWRPPSAGPLPNVKPEDCGDLSRALVDNTRQAIKEMQQHFPGYDEKPGYEISGLVWFQGYNDMFDEVARKQYGRNLVMLSNDLRKDLQAPKMKVVVGVMGVNGPRNEIGKQKELRDGHRFVNTVPEFKGNVLAIETAPLLHPKILELNLAGSPPDGIPRVGAFLYPERDLKKNPITPEEQAMLKRATSNAGYHYFGEGRFFILLGKAFSDAMLGLMHTKE